MSIEQNRVIAEYDGWVVKGQSVSGGDVMTTSHPTLGRLDLVQLKDMHYHDQIEWLWPVARKVCEELISTGVKHIDMYTGKYLAITGALCEFDLPALFASVHDGVVFLNEVKKEK